MTVDLLNRYKDWVRRNPGVIQNFDWLLLLAAWNPSRTSGGAEFTYEAYHAAIGLLSLWHQNILEEGELPTSRPTPYIWLDALEHVETLIELRGIRLEERGRMSRYGPLLAVEMIKATLKMAAWGRYSGHCFLRRPSPDDLHQFESEIGLQDILASLERLRQKYTAAEAAYRSAVASARTAAAAAGPAPRQGPCGASSSGSSYGIRQYLGGWVSGLVGRGPGGCESSSCGQQQAAAEEEERCRSGAAAGVSPRCAATTNGSDPWFSGSGWSITSAAQQQQPHQAPVGGRGLPFGVTGGAGGRYAAFAAAGLSVVREEWRRTAAERAAEDPDAVIGRNLLWLAELLHIWRPVVYVSLLKRYGRRAWKPWLLSLLMDLSSGHFHRRGCQHLAAAEARAASAKAAALAAEAEPLGPPEEGAAEAGAIGEANGTAEAVKPPAPPAPPAAAAVARGAGTSLLSLALARSLAAPGLTPGEERELYERRKKLLLYGLRSPFLEAVPLAVLSRLRRVTSRVPLLGFGADYLYGLVDTFTAYYSYTSGSN